MKTVLIFGISSFVGSNLADFLKKDFKVVGTYHNSPVEISGVLTVPCDVLSKDEVQLVLYSFRPDFTIYAVGLSSLISCHLADQLADALNTVGLFNVSEYCQRYKSQIMFLSSAYVFGGEEKNYVEMDIPDSNTMYGKTKASAEFYVQKTSLNYLIFRCGQLYGRSINPKQSTWFELMQRKLRDNESFGYDSNVKTGFLDIYYLAMIIKLCMDQGLSNRLVQISSQDTYSMYDFASKYAEIFGESKDLAGKGKWPFPHIASPTSTYAGGDLHYKLDIGNLESLLKIKLPTVEESIKFTYKRYHGSDLSKRRNTKGEEVQFI
jgi:dTDP-4-dehydrorhamnose reductase